MNNLSARLIVNRWLKASGHAPISGDKSYIEFAMELRRTAAPKQVQATFTDRAEACRYIRDRAGQLQHRTTGAAAA